MSEDYNNNQTQSENIHDEVVDNIPENTKNIDDEAQSVHSSVHIETAPRRRRENPSLHYTASGWSPR